MAGRGEKKAVHSAELRWNSDHLEQTDHAYTVRWELDYAAGVDWHLRKPWGAKWETILWWSKLFLLCVCDLRAGEEKFCQDNLSFLFHLWNLKKRKKKSAEKNIFCHFFQDKTTIFHIFTKIKELIKIIDIQYKSFVIALLEK